jgi:hypothetical protein
MDQTTKKQNMKALFVNNTLELSFDKVPDAGVRACLKKLGYKWNPMRRVWYLHDPSDMHCVNGRMVNVDGVKVAIDYLSVHGIDETTRTNLEHHVKNERRRQIDISIMRAQGIE